MHPLPTDYKPRDTEMDGIVGWFMLAFEADVNHEYSFTLRTDGTILPDVDFQHLEPKDAGLFFRWLADPTLSSVMFIQNRRGSDVRLRHSWSG